MSNSDDEILRFLMKSRDRIAGATWIIVRDTQAAEDIFQNVVIKALTKNVEFHSDGELLSWAMITARHEAIDWTRRQQKETLVPETKVLELLENDWIDSRNQDDSRSEALRECIRALPEKTSQLLKLRYFDEMSCGEIAKRLKAELNAIYKRLSRAHQALRKCVESKQVASFAFEQGSFEKGNGA